MVEDNPSSACPKSGALAEFAAGSLPGDAAMILENHLRTCADCRRLLDELRQDEELTGQLRSALGLAEGASLRRRLCQVTAGDYEILETLGHGGRGVVFKARDMKLGRMVAIKCLLGDGPDSLTAALREAGHLATINHPNIAAVYAVSEQPQVPFIVMEYIDGQPINDAMGGRLVSQQVEIFRQALQAVGQLHRHGLTHRDLKPGNILLDRQGVVKLVDFGIASPVEMGYSGRAEGTPAYLSPEQSLGEAAKPTADVFSLGVILFELLTGQRPFAGQTEARVIAAIRQNDPPLPRSLRQEIPGALQAICLTALEKDPARRYPSAREFLLDLERFLHGEAVSADPSLLASVLDHGIERHIVDLDRWQKDRMISTRECDYFLDNYERLRQREESWVLDSRRISFSQVMLHLGGWSCVVSAFLMLAFPWPHLAGARPMLPTALFGLLLATGLALWRWRTNRVAIVLLMAAAITCPIAVATGLVHFWLLGGGDKKVDLLGGIVGNRQLLAAMLSALALSLLLWRHTKTAAFGIISALGVVGVATAIFGLKGLRPQLEQGHLDTIAGWYLWPGMLLIGLALAWDLRWKVRAFAGPFYIMGLTILLASVTLIARFGPTLQWLGWAHLDNGPELTRQIKYSFMFNGLVYLMAGLVADRSVNSSWLRRIGTLLFWLAPSHLLVSILALENQWPILSSSWTVAELLLPLGALGFVFSSVPKQMKSFFFSGLFYLAISVQRLTARHFEDVLAWPIALAAIGLVLVLTAWRWPTLLDKRG